MIKFLITSYKLRFLFDRKIILLQKMAYLLLLLYRSETFLSRVLWSYGSITMTLLRGSIIITLLYGRIKFTVLYGGITVTLIFEIIHIIILCGSMTITLLYSTIKSLWKHIYFNNILLHMVIIQYLLKIYFTHRHISLTIIKTFLDSDIHLPNIHVRNPFFPPQPQPFPRL